MGDDTAGRRKCDSRDLYGEWGPVCRDCGRWRQIRQPIWGQVCGVQSNNWYDWNVRNWGTKWDVASTDEEIYSETSLIDEGIDDNQKYFLVYRFDTAWSPPIPVIEKLSKQYPSLKINLDFEEETGWGGEIEFTDGQQIVLSEYGWQCRECSAQLEETPWCDDCEYDMCPECGYGEPDEECKKHKEAIDG